MRREGQSLIEILVAVGVAAILFLGAASLVVPAIRTNQTAGQIQIGTALGKELLENVRAFSAGNWNSMLNLATGSANTYYLLTSTSSFTAATGTESIVVGTTTYKRSFYLSDAWRDGSGYVTTTASGNTYDPSTKQVTVAYNWTGGVTTTANEYLTRNQTAVFDQTDWSGGPGTNGPLTTTSNQFATSVNINYTSTVGSINVNGF